MYEKERRLKESLKMMGVSNLTQWASWFMQYFLFLMISMIIITILLKAGGVLQNSDGTVIFVYLMLFAIVCLARRRPMRH